MAILKGFTTACMFVVAGEHGAMSASMKTVTRAYLILLGTLDATMAAEALMRSVLCSLVERNRQRCSLFAGEAPATPAPVTVTDAGEC